MIGYLSELVQIEEVITTAAAAAATSTSAAVNMAGFDGCAFVGSISAAGAGSLAKAQQSATSGGTYVDLEGTSQPLTTNTRFIIDIQNPGKQFLKCIVIRGTSVVLGGIWAIRYRGKSLAQSQAGALLGLEKFVSPAEGTA